MSQHVKSEFHELKRWYYHSGKLYLGSKVKNCQFFVFFSNANLRLSFENGDMVHSGNSYLSQTWFRNEMVHLISHCVCVYCVSKFAPEIGRKWQNWHFPLCKCWKYFYTNVLEMPWGFQKCIIYVCRTSISGRKVEFLHDFSLCLHFGIHVLWLKKEPILTQTWEILMISSWFDIISNISLPFASFWITPGSESASCQKSRRSRWLLLQHTTECADCWRRPSQWQLWSLFTQKWQDLRLLLVKMKVLPTCQDWLSRIKLMTKAHWEVIFGVKIDT